MFESGQVVGDRYRLEGRLGDNESRQTWLAKDSESGDLVVLKLLALNGLTQWDDVKFLEREADTLRLLDHPQLPKFRDYVELPDHKGWFALVMDYIPGVSLKQKLKERHRFEVKEIEAIARSVLKILDYLHHHRPPIFHRDIKPSNLIAGEDGKIYLIDFGAVQNQPRQLGSTFTVAGTYGYTPIEQFGGQTSPASDLYAFGATLVHLLTGIAPMDLPQHDFRLQFRDALPEDLSQGWVNWLENLTAPSVGDRYKSVTTALNELLILQRDRRRGNETRRSPQAIPPSSIEFSDRWQASAPQGHIVITDHGDHIAIDVPSQFDIQVLHRWRSWSQGILENLRIRPKAVRQEWQAVKGSNLWKINLIVMIVFLVTNPQTVISGLIQLLVISLKVLIGSFPFLLMGFIFLSSYLNYFNSASFALSGDRFVLKFRGPNGRILRGYLHQIQSCEVVRLKDGVDAPHALAIAIRPEGRWNFNARPIIYTVGHRLPQQELEQTSHRIQMWLKTHDPQLSTTTTAR